MCRPILTTLVLIAACATSDPVPDAAAPSDTTTPPAVDTDDAGASDHTDLPADTDPNDATDPTDDSDASVDTDTDTPSDTNPPEDTDPPIDTDSPEDTDLPFPPYEICQAPLDGDTSHMQYLIDQHVPETTWTDWLDNRCASPSDTTSCYPPPQICESEGVAYHVAATTGLSFSHAWAFYRVSDGALVARKLGSDAIEFCDYQHNIVYLGAVLSGSCWTVSGVPATAVP